MTTIQHDLLARSFASADVANRDCPVCSATARKVILVGDRHDLGLTFVCCHSCGAVFLSPLPDQKWFDTFYAKCYWQYYLPLTTESHYPVSVRRAREILSTILPTLPHTPVRCLDVGCGPGAMLAEMAAFLPQADIWGTEPSIESREFCAKNGNRQVCESLDEVAARGDRFDFITLTHVLEHTLHPLSLLAVVRDLLSPNGRVYVEVPDIRSSRWNGFSFFHIAHVINFDESTLRFALQRSGLSTERVFRGIVTDWPWAVGALAGAAATTVVPGSHARRNEPSLEEHVAERLKAPPAARPPVRHDSGVAPRNRGALSRLRHRVREALCIQRRSTSALEDSVGHLDSQVRAIRQELDLLQHTFSLCAASPHAAWLYRNRAERMDIDSPLFASSRRRFHGYRYRFAMAYVKSARVGDIACGTGYGAEMLRMAGATSVVGIDIDPETIEYAKTVHGGEGIEYRCASGDATGLPDASLDLVVSFETIEHVPNDEVLLAEFARILRPGGRLIISTPNDWPIDASPHHVRTYDRTAFERALGRFFEMEDMYNQNSGGDSPFNHGQPAGIVPTTVANDGLAECLIAVARKPVVSAAAAR